ncbi:polyketide synthase dehydratase domain-containing protein, partial [Streptomyces sioyaensis]|uniref:polyketide synthase dehydratase domain-containing protein n=1 Tax=Streptomyces sioyaensis TaxID=67364 RepID=UPI0033C3EA33
DVGAALVGSRSVFRHRAVVWGAGDEELLTGLESVAAGTPGPNAVVGSARSGKTALLLSGARVHIGVARELYDTYPAFARAIDEVSALLKDRLGHDPADMIRVPDDKPESSGPLTERHAASVTFACEVALCRLLDSLGVVADYLLADVGSEVSAAHVAGVLELSDACTLWAAREQLAPTGAERPDAEAGDAVAARASWDERTEEFRRAISGIEYRTEQQPLVSAATGRALGPERLGSPDEWLGDEGSQDGEHLRTVVSDLRRQGAVRFLEVGPPSRLTPVVADRVAEDAKATGAVLLDARRTAAPTVLGVLGELFVHGLNVRWHHAAPRRARQQQDVAVVLPTYAFQRKRYWLADSGSTPTGADRGRADRPSVASYARTLLGEPIALADTTRRWFQGRYPSDGSPGGGRDGARSPSPAVLLEWVLEAARSGTAHESGGAWELRGVDLSGARSLDTDGAVTTQTVVAGPEGCDGVRCYAGTGPRGAERWVEQVAVESLTPAAWTERDIGRPEGLLVGMRELPPQDGGVFRRVGRKGTEILAQFGGPAPGDEDSRSPSASGAAVRPPAEGTWLVPLALERFLGLLAAESEAIAPGVPLAMEAVRVHEPMPSSRVWCHAIRRASQARHMVFDLKVMSDAGVLLAEIDGLTYGETPDVADGACTEACIPDGARTDQASAARIA